MQPINRRSSMGTMITFKLAALFLAASPVNTFAEVSFSRDIRPLLSDRCFACHGPDEQSREAGLRLDEGDGDDGALGLAIEPGSIAESELWNRITSTNPESQMPPPDSHLDPLSEVEQKLIRRWIESGAKYEQFWAFTPPSLPAIPDIDSTYWTSSVGPQVKLNPIDAFVLRYLDEQAMQPAEEADARTLIRRLTFDLTGLPPTREEITAFIADYESAPELAWQECIDRLLQRSTFGEHMARYWLDLVRFADTNGMHKDFYRNNVAYRDWVIRSFNDNLPYEDFLKYQLAGDLFADPSNEQLIASGFNRLHLIIDRGTALPEESQFKNIVDRVTAVGTAFLGLTVQCAQCHDHKFDPITQKDFFSLFAFFDNIDAEPETVARPTEGLQEPFIRMPTAKQSALLKTLDQQLGQFKKNLKTVSEQEADKLTQQIKSLEKQRQQVNTSIAKAMVMKDRSEARPTHVRIRGQYDAIGEIVPRDSPAFLPPLQKKSEVATRMDLANWFVDPQHPLTARVAVNRFWQQLFGVGLSKTSEDLGNQGEVPRHTELLDYLSVSFMQSGWDIKALIKEIVSSKTYRQSSLATPNEFKQDPENRLLARGSRYRLDAEMIRDSILATSGLLSNKMYGPSVKPPQPAGLWKAVSMTSERFKPDQGEDIYRRSVYTFWKRAMPPPQMTILNAPMRDACNARRERTNTPLQALLLLNESQYLAAARSLALETLKQPKRERINFAWETVTAYQPDQQEKKIMQALLRDLVAKYESDPELTDEVCDGAVMDTAKKIETAAWTILGNTLFNLDITKTKN